MRCIFAKEALFIPPAGFTSLSEAGKAGFRIYVEYTQFESRRKEDTFSK